MYFEKKLSSRNKKVNMNDHIEKYSFFQFVDPKRRKAFKASSNNEEQMKCYADIAAAALATLFSHYRSEKAIEEAMQCCVAILESKGYTASQTIEGTSFKSVLESDLVIAVLGCQIDTILRNRVEAAVKSIEQLTYGMHVTLIFSGSSPRRRSARIPDESQYMDTYYRSGKYVDRLKKLRERDIVIRIIKESASRTTDDNINKLQLAIKKNHIEKAPLILVSSNFHLARVAEKIMSSLQDQSIILCGSEDPFYLDDVSTSSRYIKQLFYEVFFNLIKEKKFLT